MDGILQPVFKQFVTGAEYSAGYSYGPGHIHDTYKIETSGSETDDFILQRLNNSIFKDIPLLQSNIERVTTHIRSHLASEKATDIERKVLTLISSVEGKSWVIDDKGDYWRMYRYIKNHRSYDIVDSPEKAFQGGLAIGRFQRQLSDLPPPPLHETIPLFHNIEYRLEQFFSSLKRDPVGRAKFINEETAFVMNRAEQMKTILKLGREGRIPERITHNDTKFNNILLDENDHAMCLIDLDTVMPGYVHYDFGDSIRTCANSSAEDETDLEKVKMDISLFKAFANGYLDEMKSVLNRDETENLAHAPSLITFIMGLRFLTDYVNGDKYYKISRKTHNLDRARAQFKLVKSNEEQFSQMQDIILELTA